MPKLSSMGIGKATLRGLRKCVNCGTVNGTKGLVCKNKSCNTLLRECNGKKKCWADACRLDTGCSTRVYSVRVRDKGPECRGFVQLPTTMNDSSDANSTALCFVDKCDGNFNAKVLQCHERNQNNKSPFCDHINASGQCTTNAIPLPLNTAVLDALSINPRVKEEVWQLFSESVGPTVQRVSRTVMAVACRANSDSPLGYLHVSFTCGRTDQDIKFFCPCSSHTDEKTEIIENRCTHFYACICAFINQDALRDEFYSFIRLEVALDLPAAIDEDTPKIDEKPVDADSDLASLLESNGCHVEVLQDDVCTILSQSISEDVSNILSNTLPEDAVVCCEPEVLNDSFEAEHSLSFPLEDGDIDHNQLAIDALNLLPSGSGTSSVDLLTLDLSRCSPQLEKIPHYTQPSLQFGQPDASCFVETTIQPVIPIKRVKSGSSRAHFSFIEWLGSVTETLNQHMHYQFPGKSVSVVFQVPAKFFEKLKERIYKSHRRRIVTSVSSFTRTDSLPIGTFTKYTWTLSSRMHVKSIFDTPNVPLQLVRSFIRSTEGNFLALEPQSNLKIPLYKTYLRVGLHKEEKEPALFKIEWIPDLLPTSQIGELSIEFEYGHVPCISNL